MEREHPEERRLCVQKMRQNDAQAPVTCPSHQKQDHSSRIKIQTEQRDYTVFLLSQQRTLKQGSLYIE